MHAKKICTYSHQECPGYCYLWVASLPIIVTNYMPWNEYTGGRLSILDTYYYGNGSGLSY